MIWLLGISIALPWYWLFVIYTNRYCNWYDRELLMTQHPKTNWIKLLPGRIRQAWLEYVDEVDQLWPSK